MSRKWIILSTLAVAAAAGGGYFWHQRQVAAAAAAGALPSDTYVAPVVLGNIVQSVASTGYVVSNLDVAIKCRASGEVVELPYDISDHVKKGDLLVRLDKADEQVLVDQATVNEAQSKSKLEEAKQIEQQAELDLQTATEQAEATIASADIKSHNLASKAKRQQELLSQNLASQEEYETAQTDAAQADADLQTARIAKEELKSQSVALEEKKVDVDLAREQLQLDDIALKNANQQSDYTTVRAPIDGVIADLQIEKGTIISSAISNVGGGTTVITLSDMSRIFILAQVDESDIGGVLVGQKVDITADAFPGKKFEGQVVRIATQGVNSSNVVTFEVKIEVTSPNKDLLKPQMTANVQIIEANKEQVIEAPVLAVVRRDHKTTVTVVKPDNSNEDRDVQVGITDGDNQEIISGLAVGDQVLVHKNEAANRWTSQGGPARPLGIPGGGRR